MIAARIRFQHFFQSDIVTGAEAKISVIENILDPGMGKQVTDRIRR